MATLTLRLEHFKCALEKAGPMNDPAEFYMNSLDRLTGTAQHLAQYRDIDHAAILAAGNAVLARHPLSALTFAALTLRVRNAF